MLEHGRYKRDIFSRLAFVEYGYFYDLDYTWYYIIPGPMRIKIPLKYIANHLDEDDFEFDERNKIQKDLAMRMLEEPKVKNIIKKYKTTPEEIREEIIQSEFPINRIIFDKYRNIHNYFDDWAVLKTDEAYENITDFLIRPRQKGKRVETIDW